MRETKKITVRHDSESEILPESVYEKELYKQRIKGKTWDELMEESQDWREVFRSFGHNV